MYKRKTAKARLRRSLESVNRWCATHRHTSIAAQHPELWAMADALRGSMDAAEYKHVVLGLIFLKYISDAFEERHAVSLLSHIIPIGNACPLASEKKPVRSH